MIAPEKPHNEDERLKALYEYQVLDSLDEEEYNDITRMASDICMTPISVISIIDFHRQWFKSKIGLDAKETEREISFCGHAIHKPGEIMIVPDARMDVRFADNPLVIGDPGIVFYAGVPLIDENGFALGTLCAIDNKPHELNEKQVDSLKLLAKKAMTLLSLRKKNKELSESKKMLIESINFISPFFLLIDKHETILEIGNNFSKANPELKCGNHFSDFFEWERKFDLAAFLADTLQVNKLLFLKSKTKTQRYKCSVKKYNNHSYFIFASALINSEFNLQNYNLRLTDFPRQDYVAEFLFLQQAAAKGLEDSRKLNENLLKKNKLLESAKTDLLNINNKLEEKVNERTKEIKNLALFPEQNPNPVFELNYENKKITYLNPAAKNKILKERIITYEECVSLVNLTNDEIEKKSVKKIEFLFENKYYERNIFFLEQSPIIRLYLHDITEIRLKEIEEKKIKEKFIERQEKLIHLRSLSVKIKLEDKLKLALELCAQEFNANFCSFYEYETIENVLKCKSIHGKLDNDLSVNKIIKLSQSPKYFKKLISEKSVFYSTTSNFEEWEEMRESFHDAPSILSCLDISVFKSEELIGIIRLKFCEIRSTIEVDELAFAFRISDIISLFFEAERLRVSREELKNKNSELQNSYDRLLELQTEIVKQEKLATLGMLIAGIAHEINTPLGAIKASNENINDGIKRELAETISKIEPELVKLSFDLFLLHKRHKEILSTKEERELYRKIENEIKTKIPDLQNTMIFSRKIFDLGFLEIDERILPFLIHQEAITIFTFASNLVKIIKSSDTIGIAVDKAARVVKALNNFSHGNISQEISNFNLRESIDSIVVLLWNKIKKGATVLNEIGSDVELMGNQEELSQVWTNILNNALQASDSRVTIKISHQLLNGWHELIFANNGPAIPEAHLPKIFDAFFSTKKRGEGTGLGLNIVKKIIEKHEGLIHCESSADETKFIIRIKNKAHG